jgi:hypothetical protein
MAAPVAASDSSNFALPAPGPRHLGVLLGFALAKIALHLTAITQYGWFRDELYYVACARHLAWGYVDQPPLSIAVLALVTRVFGESLIAIRVVPMLAGAATVWLTGALAREFGGGRVAQALACLAAIAAPIFLGVDHYYSMNALDQLLWAAAAYALVACLRTGRPRDWVVLGLAIGLGLLNKLSMLWFGGALGLGLIATPYRRVLATPGTYLTGAVAAVLAAPHVLWQVANGWPTLEFMHNAAARKMSPVSPLEFAQGQLLGMGVGAALVWGAGLSWALFARAARSMRIFALIYLAVLALLVAAGKSRADYLAVAYPPLLALGGVAWGRAASRPAGRVLAAAVATLVIAFAALELPFALPVLAPETFIRYQAALGMKPETNERLELASLPQHYADMFGWDDMVGLVAKAYARLTPEERRHVVVFGQNYGESGAVDVLGKPLGLPRAIGRHNSYWTWGPGDFDGSVLIIIGGKREDNAQFFEDIEVVGQTSSPWAMPYERGLDVSIARRPKVDLRAAWARLKLFI